MRDEKFIYIKNMDVDGKLFTNMLAVIGKPENGGNNYFIIMPLVHESKHIYLGLHNNSGEVCNLIPSLKLGRYCTSEDICNSTEKNYIILKNIHDILQVNL